MFHKSFSSLPGNVRGFILSSECALVAPSVRAPPAAAAAAVVVVVAAAGSNDRVINTYEAVASKEVTHVVD